MNNADKVKKGELRKLILQSRDELDFETANEKSLLAAKNVIGSTIFAQSKNIMVFSSFRSEINTAEIINEIFANEKNLYMPLCVTKTNEIVCCLVTNMDELEQSSYGILEPGQDFLFIGDCRDLDLVIVPGAAFDLSGHRIGYGAGFYDRLLSRPGMKAITMGYCFNMQIVPYVTNSPHDAILDYVCSEKGVIRIEK